MLLVREVQPDDLDAMWALIRSASAGMTSLQIDKPQLADRIEQSHFAFRRTTEKPEGAPYVFVLQDTATGDIVGTSCIFSKTGGYEPFYAYRIVTENSYCELLHLSLETRSLHLVKIHNGPTEIGSLFLSPAFRGRGCGKLLSLSRFAYMAGHPKRFADQTIAEMRGSIDADGKSPFWDAIGAHFFKIDFPRADTLSMVDKQFIEDLMPRHPIYLDLLPLAATESMGRVHEQTRPALAMLEAQGFQPNGLIDIFDGGPVVECKTQNIQAVREARLLRAVSSDMIHHDASSRMLSRAIVSTDTSPFISIQCQARISDNCIAMEAGELERLRSKVSDQLWVIS